MKNLRFLCLISMIFFFGKDLHSQKIFRDGYVIKKNGETLSGLVEYSANQDIPSICIFKRFDIARMVKYGPQEILAYGYKNGNRYESKDMDNKIAFYEVIVTGEIILYRKGSRYYLDKDYRGLVELKNGPITYPDNGRNIEFKDLPEFLRYITEGKSGTISDKFNLKNEITPLVTSFNKNSGKVYYVFNRSISEKQLAQRALQTGVKKSRFGLVSGVNMYLLSLTPAPDNSNFLPIPEMETCPVYGFTFERQLSRKTDRFSLKIDLIYNKQTFYCYEEYINKYYIYRDDVFFNFSGIKTPVLFQYSVTGKRLIPYFNAGFAYQYVVDKSYLQIREAENPSTHEVRTYEYRNIGFQTGEISAIAGLGLKTRIFNNLNLQFQGRIEYGLGMLKNLNTSDESFKQNSIQATLLFGITF